MKTLLTDFPETAHKELARITALIREAADPEFIVLFGRYAQTPMPGARGGYELLVVTAREAAPLPQELLQRIEAAFPRAERSERFLFLHCLPMSFVSGHLSLSLFLRTIVAEGILLYDSRRFRYFRVRDFKPAQSARRAQENYNLWYGQGKACLHTAKWTLQQGYPRLAAGNLYLAAAAYLKAAELVCYGYQNPHSDLRSLFVRIARFSAELSDLLGFPDRFDRKFFYRLDAFRRHAATSPRFVLHAEAYHYVQERVERMDGIIRDLCGEWLGRLDAIRYAAPGCKAPGVPESAGAAAAELSAEREPEPPAKPSAVAQAADRDVTAVRDGMADQDVTSVPDIPADREGMAVPDIPADRDLAEVQDGTSGEKRVRETVADSQEPGESTTTSCI